MRCYVHKTRASGTRIWTSVNCSLMVISDEWISVPVRDAGTQTTSEANTRRSGDFDDVCGSVISSDLMIPGTRRNAKSDSATSKPSRTAQSDIRSLYHEMECKVS